MTDPVPNETVLPDAVILTCAVAGGIETGNPNQPHTMDDVVCEVLGAWRAGASIAHIHARTVEGGMTQDPEVYEAIKQGIRAQGSDIVLNFTTGGPFGMAAPLRRRSLEAFPEVASLNAGSINFGPSGAIFANPLPLVEELAAEMDERRIVREYECFDIGMAVTAARLARSAPGPTGMMHLVLGVVGGAPATVEMICLFANLVPPNVPWMATGVGRANFPIMAATLACGGHVRTGLEDVVYSGKGRYAESNAELVERARSLIDAVGRPLATPAQARAILGVGSNAARLRQ